MSTSSGSDRSRIEVFGWSASSIERRLCASIPEAIEVARSYRSAWVDLEGISTVDCAMHLESVAELPALAADTLIDGVRRPGADDFGDLTVITMRSHPPGGIVEFVDFLLMPSIVLTIQEKTGGDCFESVREKLAGRGPHLLRADASMVFLLLSRAVCDGYRPLLEQYNESLEHFEKVLVRKPDTSMLDRIHQHRRELLFLRQGLAPLREALSSLRESITFQGPPSDASRSRLAALRELQDEVGALLDVVEFQKDSAQHLLDLYLNAASNRLNEIVRVLTIISVIFMPLTLIAGIYGMNFEGDGPFAMPELRWRYGYPFALGLMLVCALSLVWFFWARGWIGDPLRRRRQRSAASQAVVAIRAARTSTLGLILPGRRQRTHRPDASAPPKSQEFPRK